MTTKEFAKHLEDSKKIIEKAEKDYRQARQLLDKQYGIEFLPRYQLDPNDFMLRIHVKVKSLIKPKRLCIGSVFKSGQDWKTALVFNFPEKVTRVIGNKIYRHQLVKTEGWNESTPFGKDTCWKESTWISDAVAALIVSGVEFEVGKNWK